MNRPGLVLPQLQEGQAYALMNDDSLHATRLLPGESIDLVYADPPFFTKRIFQIDKRVAFSDRWDGGLAGYLKWIGPRLREFHRVLKPTGSMYLHCDTHASHYLKVAMDEIFGYKNFINEIVWKRQSAHNDAKQGSRHFGRIHDVILFYGKSKEYVWTPQFHAYEERYVRRTYCHVEKHTNRRYALGDLTAPGGPSKRNPLYTFMGLKRYWRYSQSRMKELLDEGRIEVPPRGGLPRVKRYLDEMKGLPVQDLWIDNDLYRSRESLVYPTQKPERLLERIVLSSSRPEGIILDPFCGSGTTLAVATRFGRRSIGIDTSKSALKTAEFRLKNELSKRSVESQPHPNHRHISQIIS
jgi:DNA modification methylase